MDCWLLAPQRRDTKPRQKKNISIVANPAGFVHYYSFRENRPEIALFNYAAIPNLKFFGFKTGTLGRSDRGYGADPEAG